MNVFCYLMFAVFGMAPNQTDVSVLVTDGDTGEPVENALVEIEFPFGMAEDGTTCGGVRARKTNAKGMCKASGTAAATHVAIRVQKEGFYRSRLDAALRLGEDRRDYTECSVVTVALMRVVHPIPLFVVEEPCCRSRDIFGKGTNTLEFDMMAGDYLPPVGKGKIADVVFTREPCQLLSLVTNLDYGVIYSTKDQVRVRFPNPGDGIVSMPTNSPSELSVRAAPESGYKSNYLSTRTKTANGLIESWEADPTLCFRIRTIFDDEGNILTANYGKIYRGVAFDHDHSDKKIGGQRVERMRFLYYLNPMPMDRNLEYDARHNLNKKSDCVARKP